MAKSVMAELGGQPDGNSCSMTLNEAPVQAGNAAITAQKEAGIRLGAKTPAESSHGSRSCVWRVFITALKTSFRQGSEVMVYQQTLMKPQFDCCGI